MDMKRFLLSALFLIVLCTNVNAQSDIWQKDTWQKGLGVSLGYGEGKSDIDICRLGLQKDYGVEWFKRSYGLLSGFFDLSYNYWHHESDDIHGIALSPVFAYYFGDSENFFRPYVAGGIGAAVLDRYRIKDRELGSNFQFEDRVGIGARIGKFDINCSYFHYSNAGLKMPNAGIDIWLLIGVFRF